MDYRAIYDRFIQSRRENPPDESEYFERHHIIPRCMDGGDEPENIIPLTPEDHFFAHLCLAKAYHKPRLWLAVQIMLNNPKQSLRKPNWTQLRKQYAWIRNYRVKGITHPMADTKIHKFYHIDGGVFTGTRIAFGEKYNIPAASVNSLFNRALQCYGWSLKKLTRKELEAKTSARAKKSGKLLKGYIRDKTEYDFYNIKTGQSFYGKQSDICPKYLNRSTVSAICLEKRILSRGGWCLKKNKDIAYQHACRPGERSTRFNKKKFNFCHVSGKTETSITLWEMGRKYFNGDSRGLSAVVSGSSNGHHGWYMEGKEKPRVMNVEHTMINKDGKVITGTLASLSNTIGVTKMAVVRVVKGQGLKTKGWSLVNEQS